MSANVAPIFPLTPNLGGFGKLTLANTATDGTGMNVATVFTAGGNGARLDALRLVPGGTNVATVLRLFINNGASISTATNNSLFMEIDLPPTSADNAKSNGQTLTIPLNLSLPNGYKLLACLGTAVAAGWHLTPIGGDY